jgi:hypothetical protein
MLFKEAVMVERIPVSGVSERMYLRTVLSFFVLSNGIYDAMLLFNPINYLSPY